MPFLIGATPMPARSVLPPSLHSLTDRQAHVLRDDHFPEDVRDAVARLDTATHAGRRYLGTEQDTREKRFAELVELFADRAEGGSITIRSVPWRRSENLRPQLSAIVDVLEPNEDVADLVLAAWADKERTERSGRAAVALNVVRGVSQGLLLGVLAVTPRRLIHAPRLSAASTSVVWFRDVVDVKIGLTGDVTGKMTIILNDHDVWLAIRPNKRARPTAGYIKDRIARR